jgi:hypothetical protein
VAPRVATVVHTPAYTPPPTKVNATPRPAAKAKPKAPAKPKAKHPVAPKPKSRPKHVIHKPKPVPPLGIRVTLPGTNVVLKEASSLELPAALAFLALVAASSSFVAFCVRLRRTLLRI